jgi:hypothetical protein
VKVEFTSQEIKYLYGHSWVSVIPSVKMIYRWAFVGSNRFGKPVREDL